MASRIYKSEDWQLWTYQPQLGSFVLDFSQLNGSDVLGDSSDGLAVSQYGVAGVSITSGGDMDSGVIHQQSPSNATITVNVKDFTADVMNDFYVGTAIFLAVTNPTGYFNDYTWMFYGTIQSASVSVIPGADFSTITIQAQAFSSNQLNTDVGLTKDETTDKSTLIQNAAALVGSPIYLDSSAYNFKGTARESKTLGEWLTDLALCDFMQLRDYAQSFFVEQVDYATPSTWRVLWGWDIRMNVTKTVGTSAGTLDDTTITDVMLDWSGAGSPTGVTLANYTDSAIIYQFGSTQSGSGGSVSYSATVDVKNLTQMTAIGQQLMSMTKAFRPIQITTKTATNNQTLDFKTINVPGSIDAYVAIDAYPENLYQIGDTITIDLPEFGVDNVDMIVVGRNIEVTPDDWTTSYTLWKGFTD